MQGNQFPSSNENINIQLRLSPLILLSEGLEKEANELCRLERCFFFFLNRVSKDFFFFFSSLRGRQRRGGKELFEFLAEIDGLTPRRCCSPPVPGQEHLGDRGRLRGGLARLPTGCSCPSELLGPSLALPGSPHTAFMFIEVVLFLPLPIHFILKHIYAHL